MEHHVVLRGCKYAVAQRAGLAGDLRCAVQVHRLHQVAVVDDRVEALYRQTRRTADASRIHHRQRRARITDVAVARLRTRRCNEDLLSFEKEQALLRKERLGRAEIDDQVVGFYRREVGIDRRHQLRVRRGSPEHVAADAVTHFVLHFVPRHRRKWIQAELLPRRHLVQFDQLENRHELRFRRRQRGPTPPLIQRADAPAHIQAHPPSGSARRHRDRAPRNEELRRPAFFSELSDAVPRSVPIARVLSLRKDGAVAVRVAECDVEPESVATFAGRIDGEADFVARHLKADVATRQTRQERIRRLLQIETYIEPARCVEDPGARRVRRLLQRVGFDHDEIGDDGQLAPHRFVEATVDLHRRGVVGAGQRHHVPHLEDIVGAEHSRLCARRGLHARQQHTDKQQAGVAALKPIEHGLFAT